MDDLQRTFQLTWLTSSPLLRGHRVGIALGLVLVALSLLSLVVTLDPGESNQGAGIFASTWALSLGAIVMQFPAYLGRVVLAGDTLSVISRFSGKGGKLQIPREALDEIYFAPLNRPPKWLPFAWGIVELVFALGAISAGYGIGSGNELWYWLTGLALGLSFWPLIAARWRAGMQVVLTYQRPDDKEPGLIRAWATPHQAGSLVHTLTGKIDWKEPERPAEVM
jgi:hypothetical protein